MKLGIYFVYLKLTNSFFQLISIINLFITINIKSSTLLCNYYSNIIYNTSECDKIIILR